MKAYLGLGSNIGDRASHLRAAIEMLSEDGRVKVLKESSIYETDPVGYEDQALFLNMVIQVKTNLQPEALLALCLQIELVLGRKREVRWGPRVIDIDVLLIENKIIQTEKLVVPHPRMHERNFVKVPLLELDPHITLPTMDEPLSLCGENSNNDEGVRKWKQKDGEGESKRFEN